MAKIGIICAGDREVAPFLPHIENCAVSEKAMLKIYEGTINGVEIVTLFCGVGKTNAAIAAQILIDGYGVEMMINAGTAGGMDVSVELFDIVVATEAAHHDVHEVILTEFHPWAPSIFFKSDETLLALTRNAVAHMNTGSKVCFGRMITGEKFITDDGRDEMNAALCPLSVDMETASIAHTCYVNQIPFIAIRCITDTATHSGTENFDKNCVAASEISKNVVLELLAEIDMNAKRQ